MNDYRKDFLLDGKVALVSGGARGIGAEAARALALAGAQVLVTDVLEAQGRHTVAGIESAGGSALFLKLDVTDEAQWQAAVETAVARFGGLDILLNNAGIERMHFIADCDVQEFRTVLEVNVTGVFLGCKHAIRAMRPGGASGRGGSIINLSSIAGLAGFTGLGAYSASKGAVRLLTKSVAVECGQLKTGIRCNSIHPGLIRTDMAGDLMRHYVEFGLAADVAAAEAAFVAAHPIGHMGEPRDIANAVVYLASDASKFVTGAELAVDGGYCAR